MRHLHPFDAFFGGCVWIGFLGVPLESTSVLQYSHCTVIHMAREFGMSCIREVYEAFVTG